MFLCPILEKMSLGDNILIGVSYSFAIVNLVCVRIGALPTVSPACFLRNRTLQGHSLFTPPVLSSIIFLVFHHSPSLVRHLVDFIWPCDLTRPPFFNLSLMQLRINYLFICYFLAVIIGKQSAKLWASSEFGASISRDRPGRLFSKIFIR